MKKLLCMLLVAAMLLSFMPAFSLQAAAADGTEEVVIEEVAIAQPEEKAANTKAATQAVGKIDLNGVPDSIAPGAAEIPEIYEYDYDHISISGSQWLDANKQPVTEFVYGETYWLAVTVAPDAGYAFTETPDIIYLNDKEYELQIVSQQEAVVYICYIARPATGNINVIPTGFREGAPIAGVSVTVEGKAVLAEIEIAKIEYDEEDEDRYYDDVTEGNFEPDSLYDIRFILQPMDGYAFDGDRDNFTVNGSGGSYGYDGDELWLDWTFCTGEEITEIALSMSEIAPGVKVEDVELTVPAGANYVVYYYSFHDENYNGLEEGDIFQINHRYGLGCSLIPKNGYGFADEVSVTLNGKPISPSISDAAEVYVGEGFDFTPADDIRVYGLPYEIEAGVAETPEIYDIGYDEVTIANVQWVNADKQPVTTLEEGKDYYLAITVTPNGYGGLSQEPDVSFYNVGEWHFEWIDENTGIVYVRYSVEIKTVEFIVLEYLPDRIYEGAEESEYFWNLEDLEETGGQVTITSAQWLDAQKKPVSKIEDGKGYYLAITVEAADAKKFNGTPPISFGRWNEKYVYEVKLVSQTEAIVYVYYSLEQSIEELDIQVTGVQEGAKIEDVKATVSGNATMEEVRVYQYVQGEDGDYYTETVTEGVFEADSNYLIGYTLKAKSGYSFSEWVDIAVNGVEEYYDSYGGNLFASAESFFTTCEKIESVELTVPKVEVGKNFADLKVTAPQNANYTVSYSWEDTTDELEEAAGQVAKKHSYCLRIMLSPKKGYVLAHDLEVTLNGEQMDCDIYSDGLSAAALEYYSFLEQITKVELPAMPKSVSLGSTLPADFAVDDSKNYTVQSGWNLDGEWVEKATEKGIYRLQLDANLKPGYEFSEDVKVYVGGQLQEDAYVYGSYCSVSKLYIVGLQEISKVELTFAEPQVGKAVSEVKAASNAKYTVTWSAWAQSASDEMDESTSRVEIYQGGQYLYMGVDLIAKDGYALSFDCDIYLNGKKVTPIDMYCDGKICYLTFALGKLGEFKKLAAPKLTKTGAALSWETVAYADAYEVYRAISKSGKYTKVATITETTWQDESAVASGKAYDYKVKAVYTADAGKNSGFSSVVSVDYPCATPELTVTAGSTGKPVLTWNKITGAKKYEIWRSVDGGTFKKLTTVTKLTYTDSKATAGAECTYMVKALGSKSAYNSAFSETGSCYVTCAAPSITLKLDSKTGKPSLSWKKVTGASGYAIYRSDNDGEYELLTTVTTVSYKDTSAQMDNKYSYYVVTLGKNEVFNSVASGIKTTTLTLKAPKLTGSADAEGKPVISWTAVEGAEKYEIYRSTKSSKGYTLLAEVEGTSYTDTSVATGKTNYYKVVAVGKNTQSAMSAYLKQIGKCAAPTISVELDETSGKPVISWEKVAGASKYTVYSATSENGKYKSIGTSKTTSYTDSKAVPGTQYYYKVVANGSKSSYNSTYSNVTFAVGYAAKPQVTLKNDSKGKPVVSWKKVSEADKYVVVYVDVTDMEDESQMTEQFVMDNLQYVEVSKKKTSVTLTQAQTGRLYLVCVVAIPKNEEFFNFSQLGYVAATCAAPKISGKYLLGYNCGTWKPVEGAEGYAIYRSTKANGEYELLGYIDNDTSFVDLSAVKGKTYYYKVTACTEHTESAFSNYIKLKTK